MPPAHRRRGQGRSSLAANPFARTIHPGAVARAATKGFCNTMPTWLIVLITVVATYLLSVIVRAFTPHEKKVNYLIEHRFGVNDEQFLRSMGSLLPPASLPGNRITPLFNGDAFFPVMVDAIRAARHTITFET